MKRSFCGFSFSLGLVLAIEGHLRISRSIGQPLADDTTKGTLGATFILDANRTAMTISEIELCKIAVKMALGTVLINALHATLEDREIALDGVGVNFAAPVLASAVAHNAMRGKFTANVLVIAGFVGHQARFARQVLANERRDGIGLKPALPR